MTPEKAAVLVEDPLFLACLMIKAGDADGEIAGALNTTGNVLRPALQIIKTAPGMSCVSGAFLMFTKTPQYGEDGLDSSSYCRYRTSCSYVEFLNKRQCISRNG